MQIEADLEGTETGPQMYLMHLYHFSLHFAVWRSLHGTSSHVPKTPLAGYLSTRAVLYRPTDLVHGHIQSININSMILMLSLTIYIMPKLAWKRLVSAV